MMMKRSVSEGGTTDAPSPVGVWLAAARPKTLWASLCPVLYGACLAAREESFSPLLFAEILLSALCIQIGTNFANDLFDYLKGADTADRLGPVRATQAGLVTPLQMASGTGIVLGLALLIGVHLVMLGGWPIAVIGTLSLLLAIWYTGGPYPLAYHGLGDIFVLLFFGPVATSGTYYLFSRSFSAEALWGGIGSGMLSTAILVVNNIRDVESDRRAGKRTLAVRFGVRASRIEYAALLLGALLSPVLLVATGVAPPGILLSLGSAPFLVRAVKRIYGNPSPAELNILLGTTGKLLALYGTLLSLGALWQGL